MTPNDFESIQMTSVDFLDTFRVISDHFESFWIICSQEATNLAIL